MVEGIKEVLRAAGLLKNDLKYVFDAVSEGSPFTNIAAVINPTSGQTTHVLPAVRFAPKGSQYPEGVKSGLTMVGVVHDAGGDFISPEMTKTLAISGFGTLPDYLRMED